MSAYDPDRDPVRRVGRALRWGARFVALPAILGALISVNVDVRALPMMHDLYTPPEVRPRLAALRAGAKLNDALAVPHLVEIAGMPVEVPGHFGQGVERVQRVEVAGLERAQEEAAGLDGVGRLEHAISL